MSINLIKELEQISLKFPNKILKLKGYSLKKGKKINLEVLIYKGFSSSTTHEIEFNLEKAAINEEYYFNKGELFRFPLSKGSNRVIIENVDPKFFLNENNW